jgi:hypothetical protein
MHFLKKNDGVWIELHVKYELCKDKYGPQLNLLN